MHACIHTHPYIHTSQDFQQLEEARKKKEQDANMFKTRKVREQEREARLARYSECPIRVVFPDRTWIQVCLCVFGYVCMYVSMYIMWEQEREARLARYSECPVRVVFPDRTWIQVCLCVCMYVCMYVSMYIMREQEREARLARYSECPIRVVFPDCTWIQVRYMHTYS